MRFDRRTLPNTPAARFGARLAALGLSLALPPNIASAVAPVSTASGTAAAVRDEKSTAKPAVAAKETEKEKDSTKGAAKNLRPLTGFTPEREAAALTFVQTNHPELAQLLERLKARRPHDYEKAIRDLYRVSERLAMSEAAFPVRYELELKQWQLTSRIQLVGARLSMKRTPEQEQELKQLLVEQLEVHRELLAFNLERSKTRAASLQRELDDLNSRREAILEAKFDKAIKAADQRRPAGKVTATAEKKTDSKTDSQSDK